MPPSAADPHTTPALPMPGWPSFFMVPYDRGSTPAFRKEVRSVYGSYIANSIVEMVNGAPGAGGEGGQGASIPPAAEFAARCG